MVDVDDCDTGSELEMERGNNEGMRIGYRRLITFMNTLRGQEKVV